MTKRLFTLLLALASMVTTANAQVLFSAENFPDPKFRESLIEQFWELKEYEQLENGNWRHIYEGEIIPESVLETLSLQFPEGGITNLAGIEYFTKLEILFCYGNQLTSLDLSQNSALEALDCRSNQLTSLSVSNNTALTSLSCADNQLTSIDVSNNPALTSLTCDNNQLTSLDVSNTALEFLSCHGNPLTSLNLSCTALTRFVLNDYQLTSLNLSGCTALTELYLNNCQVTSLNLSGCTALTEPELYRIQQVTSLDVSGCTALTRLGCSNRKLMSLNVSGCTALRELNCSFNQLDFLDVSGCIALTEFNCTHNKLTSIDVSNNTKLKILGCGWNQLTELDVSNNTELMELYCWSNQLTELDVSKNVALTVLQSPKNQLTSLDISKNTALIQLDCTKNQLTSLDVSKNIELSSLYCFSNQIMGKAMDALVASLPTVESGKFYVIDTKDENEGNVCTKRQVAVAKEKGWTVYNINYGSGLWVATGGMRCDYHYELDKVEYEGSDNPLLLDEENFPDANFRAALASILGINEGDEITEETIANTTTLDVSDKAISDLSGIKHFTALTTLYCHVNQIKSEEMTALIAALPDLSSNEAKGMMRAEETNPRAGALYALDFTDENEQNVCTAEHVTAANEKGWTVYCKTTKGWQEYNGEIPTGINSIDNGKLIIDNWYSVDGVKLQGEPTRKGIYIRNGKKVVK